MEQSTNSATFPVTTDKWPTLSQLYQILFHSDYQEAHDAGADVSACARCFRVEEKGVLIP